MPNGDTVNIKFESDFAKRMDDQRLNTSEVNERRIRPAPAGTESTIKLSSSDVQFASTPNLDRREYIPRRSRSPDKENRRRPGESPSPIQDNYFEGIENIRIARDIEKRHEEDFEADRKHLINQVVQRTRMVLSENLTPSALMKRSHRTKHDGKGIFNQLQHCSKYDLDRGHVDMKAIKSEATKRKVENAKSKRDDLNKSVEKKRMDDVVKKISKIRQEAALSQAR